LFKESKLTPTILSNPVFDENEIDDFVGAIFRCTLCYYFACSNACYTLRVTREVSTNIFYLYY